MVANVGRFGPCVGGCVDRSCRAFAIRVASSGCIFCFSALLNMRSGMVQEEAKQKNTPNKISAKAQGLH